MFRRTAIAIICALSLTVTTALAGEQFVGEVLKVDTAANKLTVKKPDGNRFTFVVNAGLLYLVAGVTHRLRLESFWWALLGAIVLSVVSAVISRQVED